ncbi:glycosyltransferase [Pengzhenrongella sicca]|uniref:D-inositol 3-phosphate glycosyltransferase n=1 Tax=Pengzhenrongella sicca TaxID=2819238 RepID=A0A8A4ZEQ9_9MICO|nr:glycosyltransferase [Pengzhenrongella sicca]QTE29036.1 glycosyltransferase [Pengzhenrongella sicca]
MSRIFREVEEAAQAGDRVDQAPDYLPLAEQLNLALEQLLVFHDEVGRLAKAGQRASEASLEAIGAAETLITGRPPGPGRPERLASARQRLRSGTLTGLAFVRTVLWIVFKSERAARMEALAKLRASVPAVSSPLSGEKPVRDLVARGEHDRAYVLARALLPRHGGNKHYLALFRQVQIKRGAVTSVLATTRRIEKLEHTSPVAVRRIEGRVRELSGWYPRIPGPRVWIEPVDNETIMHLVKESRPYLSSGFTSRSHRNFLAEKAAGLNPVVVTELGFPRSIGVTDVEAVGDVDGIEHRVLDLGPGTMQDVLPVDVWLEEFAQAAFRAVQEIRPAVIHVSSGRRGYETALVGLALQEKTGLPLVYEVRSFFEANWTSEPRWEATGETFLRRLAVERMCMERADAVITLGVAMRDELVSRGADPSRLHVVPNGADIADFHATARSAVLAADLGIGELPTFGYVSNMDHYRESQETMVRAARVLRDEGRDFRCVLVGGGPRAEIVRATAERLGVAGQVVLAGPVDHTLVPDYYGLIDVFVVPRIDERAARYVTPLKPFEAMALAKPVVVSNLPALREIVNPPTRGLTFEPGDHHGLASVVARLWDDPELAESLGRAGLEWVTTERQWAMNGPRYRRIFEAARISAHDRKDPA